MMKIITIVGARPQFIKAAPVSKILRRTGHQEFFVHTGQHYDHGISQIFFDELEIPQPDVNLEVGSGNHGWQTAQMLIRIEEVMLDYKPDWVLVYGDTNSTLAGALAACKLRIPLAHVEAGLRSFNREMPEEYNRVLADHCADLLFCPTQTAVDNLASEGISIGVHLVGDVMADLITNSAEHARKQSKILQELCLEPGSFALVTIHRPSNTDNEVNLRSIVTGLAEADEQIIFPVHPRTRKTMGKYMLVNSDLTSKNLTLIDPVSYLDMVMLMQSARMILTDSGGIQKEAYCLGIPCITLREETEWIETVQAGWNILTGAATVKIINALRSFKPPAARPSLYGDGHAAEKVVDILSRK